MPRIISALLAAFSSAALLATAGAALAEATQPLELAPDAPDRYTVTAGDTLWGISAKFIKDPYRWPELWRMNAEDVKNPHRIYPGQVLVFDRATGQLRVDTVRLSPRQYDSQLSDAIPTIAQRVIEPFLDKPLVIEANGLDTAPRIIALEEGRMLVANGGKIYVTGLTDPTVNSYHVYRPGKALVNPATKELLGHEAVYLGTAKVSRKGDPAILHVGQAVAEIGKGDHLMAASKVDVLSFAPRAPKQEVSGQVISVLNAVRQGGPYSVVSLTLGTRDGIEIGHVLSLNEAGAVVKDRFKDKKTTFTLPEERYGLVFVFRTFERISYAVVMQASQEVEPGDSVRTP